MTEQTEQWPREKVIRELKLRSGEHRSIRFSDGPEDDGFKDAVFAHYGGWTGALAAAGLHPKTKLLNYWTKHEVSRQIKCIEARGESINTLSLEVNHPRLWNAARRLFGNIQNAVEAAGFDYTGFKKRGAWTEEKIASHIREHHEKGIDLSQITMLETDSKLLAAAQKVFGAWSRAVHAAGIDYTQVKEKHREDKRKRKNAEDALKKRRIYVIRDGKLIQPDIPLQPHGGTDAAQGLKIP